MYTEEQIDRIMTQWLTTKRCGTDEVNGKILGRVHELLREGFPASVSLFERAYFSLVEEKEIHPFKTKMEISETPVRHALTVDEYRLIPAQTVAKRYMREPDFKRDVDSLIERKLI